LAAWSHCVEVPRQARRESWSAESHPETINVDAKRKEITEHPELLVDLDLKPSNRALTAAAAA
jgi:hypothetical protein